MTVRQNIQKLLRKAGFDVTRIPKGVDDPSLVGFSIEEQKIIKAVRPFTMTSTERICALIEAIRHVSVNQVPGAIVECGVWRGGSTMAAILTLLGIPSTERGIYLYDTFEGMSEPTEADLAPDGIPAADLLSQGLPGIICRASLEDVKTNVLSTGYPPSKVHFVQGKVEETIPKTLPASIALLRLDTDWYESTRHELEHLFPLLHPKGVLIVDDYGHWAGARKAVDEFFGRWPGTYYFHRIDYTGRTITRIAG
jgi:O-methyltransferase